MMTSFAGDLQFKIRSPKASGPGLTVRFADNRTGARMQAIIGIAFLKSRGIFGICTPPARAGGLEAARRHIQPIVGKSSPERKRQCSLGPRRAENFPRPRLRPREPGPFSPRDRRSGDPCRI